MMTNRAVARLPYDDDRITLRGFLYDALAAISAGSFVWAVSVWLPYIAQHQ
ncbi:hypothetical protein A4U53_031120 [Rhizobium ruizarguesonis]|uniref:Uncharacterized protein n=1 Tax=Rhizobium ruizarguesonis TaxID=2081791 RepID=A0ACD5EMP9_9HYPH|nr:hypothetical protein [Rhizobium leguminosarum]